MKNRRSTKFVNVCQCENNMHFSFNNPEKPLEYQFQIFISPAHNFNVAWQDVSRNENNDNLYCYIYLN